MKNKFYCLLWVILIACPLAANALPTDKNQPATISADSATLNQTKGINQFDGHVIIVQGSTRITAIQLTTYNDKNQKLNKAIAKGMPAVYQTIPKPNEPLFQASANQINYLPNENKVVLIGNGELQQGGNVLKSEYIIYNQKTGQIITKAVNHQRTTITLQPKQTS